MSLFNLSESKPCIPESRVGVVIFDGGFDILSSLHVVTLSLVYQVSVHEEADVVVDGPR